MKVLRGLNKHGIIPSLYDPFFSEGIKIENAEYFCIEKLSDLPNKQDCILVLTPHKEFKSIKPNKLRAQ